MNIFSKFVAAIALIFFTAGGAMATTITLESNGAGHYTGTFGAVHSAAFTDTYTFLPVFDSESVDSALISIGFIPTSDINFTSVILNGISLTITNGAIDTAVTGFPFLLSGPLTLIVSGTSGLTASYAGTINVQPIPEPETYAMLLAGLGVVGWLARRRSIRPAMLA